MDIWHLATLPARFMVGFFPQWVGVEMLGQHRQSWCLALVMDSPDRSILLQIPYEYGSQFGSNQTFFASRPKI